MTSPAYLKVLKASAGSGKTHQLVNEFLLHALGSTRPDYYRHILGITFTNAAAAEMKSRILQTLHKLSVGSTDAKTALFRESLTASLHISTEELQHRAAAAYAHLLHHYGLLSIATIDAFTHRIVRAFTYELRVQHDFSIELDQTSFLESLADECLSRAGHDPALTAYLEEWMLNNLQEETQWNIRNLLVEQSGLLLDEATQKVFASTTPLTLEKASEIRRQLHLDQQADADGLRTRAEHALSLIANSGADTSQFSRGTVIKFLELVRDQKQDNYPKSLADMIAAGSFVVKKSQHDARHKALFEVLAPVVAALIDDCFGAMGLRMALRPLVRRQLYLFGLISELTALSQELRRDKNVLLISDLQKLISGVVKDSPTPFVYERIGERFHHVLIDEFQDTSELQWENFVPLIVNGLGAGYSSLLVGDAKQAIYRFRNGNVAQFVALPEVHGNADASRLFRAALKKVDLTKNYRSARHIVTFNNALYAQLKDNLEDLASVYDGANQEAHSDVDGMVRVWQCVAESVSMRNKETAQLIRGIVRDTLADGFAPGDITILVRKRKDAADIVGALAGDGIRCVTEDTYLLAHSHLVQSAVLFIEWLGNVSDVVPAGRWLHHFNMLKPEACAPEIKRWLEMARERSFTPDKMKSIIMRLLPGLAPDRVAALPLTTCLSAYFASTGLPLDAYAEYFLEYTTSFAPYEDSSVFLEHWQKDSAKLSCKFPADPQALPIMTIHKSKGLEFPVVICLVDKPESQSAMVWTDVRMLGYPVDYAYLRSNAKLANQVPEAFQREKQLELLDQINAQYVATTRACERLHVINRKSKPDAPSAFDTAMRAAFADYDPVAPCWQLGVPTLARHAAAKSSGALLVPAAYAHVASASRHEGEPDAAQQFGLWLHETMAGIHVADEDLASTERLPAHIPAEQRALLHRTALAICRHSALAPLYAPGVTALNEREICDASGTLLRPDRVVMADNTCYVVDYKTGSPQESHKTQIASYSSAIREISGLPVKTFLVYVQPGADVEVVSADC